MITEKWLAAIDKDGLNWSQVGDLNGWANEVGQLYGVNSIPHSILLRQGWGYYRQKLKRRRIARKVGGSIFEIISA